MITWSYWVHASFYLVEPLFPCSNPSQRHSQTHTSTCRHSDTHKQIHTFRHTDIHMHTHRYINRRIQTHTYAYISKHTPIPTDTHGQIHTNTHTHRHTQTHADTRRHRQTHTDTYRHTQTHIRSFTQAPLLNTFPTSTIVLVLHPASCTPIIHIYCSTNVDIVDGIVLQEGYPRNSS